MSMATEAAKAIEQTSEQRANEAYEAVKIRYPVSSCWKHGSYHEGEAFYRVYSTPFAKDDAVIGHGRDPDLAYINAASKIPAEREKRQTPVAAPSVAPEKVDAFEEWWAANRESMFGWAHCYLYAKAAWHAALASAHTEGKVTEVVYVVTADTGDFGGKEWSFNTEEPSRSAYAMAALMVGRSDGYESVSLTKHETIKRETLVETRMRKEQ